MHRITVSFGRHESRARWPGRMSLVAEETYWWAIRFANWWVERPTDFSVIRSANGLSEATNNSSVFSKAVESSAIRMSSASLPAATCKTVWRSSRSSVHCRKLLR